MNSDINFEIFQKEIYQFLIENKDSDYQSVYELIIKYDFPGLNIVRSLFFESDMYKNNQEYYYKRIKDKYKYLGR